MGLMLSVVDSHVAGEPLRFIISGPKLKGATILERERFMQERFDFIRTGTMKEPRGHADMFGAYLTEACDPKADFGVLFIACTNYCNMCGHAALAVGYAAVYTGMVPVKEPVTDVVLETGAGLVTVSVSVKDGRPADATLTGVPSFLFERDVVLEVLGKKVTVDITYGGNFFALVDYRQLGLRHDKAEISSFVRWGAEIMKQMNRLYHFKHPNSDAAYLSDNVYFYAPPEEPGGSYKVLEYFVQVDRSPCGTGTSGLVGALCAKGVIGLDEPIVTESVIGSTFTARVGDKVRVGEYNAAVPVITARPYITGIGTLIFEDGDPFADGFLLNDDYEEIMGSN